MKRSSILCGFFVILMILLVGMTVSAKEEVSYSNGGTLYTDGENEFFINPDDEDRLYKVNLAEKTEECVYDGHVISLVSEQDEIYLLVYDEGTSSVINFDKYDYSVETVTEFDSLITNFSLRADILYYTDNGDVYSYNIENSETVKMSDIGAVDFLVITDSDTIKYYVSYENGGYSENAYTSPVGSQ
jgi:hypothetical protein